MLDWIIKNKNVLSIRGIEIELKMPDSTLIKAVNGVRNLPIKWQEPLREFVINLKK